MLWKINENNNYNRLRNGINHGEVQGVGVGVGGDGKVKKKK
jgi:hypothetical protein